MATANKHVSKGDLIKAEGFNDHEDRITTLETQMAMLLANNTNGGILITQLIPDSPYTVNDPLEIRGQNFGYSDGAQRVSFDGVPIFQYGLGSNDSRLLVTVPNLPNLPKEGKNDVVLRVEHGQLFTTRVITVKPVVVELGGNVDVVWDEVNPNNPSPNPITAGQPAKFGYSLVSRATADADFLITASASTGWKTTVLKADAVTPVLNNTITLAKGATLAFFIQVDIPTNTNNTPLTLTVSSASGIVVGSDAHDFTVGVPFSNHPTGILLNETAFAATDGAGNNDPTGKLDSASKTISLKANSIGTVTFECTFTNPGTYDIAVTTSPGTTNWASGTAGTPASYTENVGGKTENPQLAVQPQTTASKTGQAVITITQRGTSNVEKRTYQLALLP